MIDLIPPGAMLAAALAVLATCGWHLVVIAEFSPRGTLITESRAVAIGLYIVGAVLCAVCTYWVWRDFAPPASVAASAAWGLAHPVVTRAAIWAAGKRWPGLVQSVRQQK